MKKLLKISIAAIGIFMITALIIIPMTAQSATQNGGGKAIPESVMKIANKSCVKCHTEGGNGMALMHLNLSNWDKYSPEKQASKAKDMCKMVTKDKMPPKSFCKSHPDDVPGEKDLKTICDWAQSIQINKK
jgi:cytochrome c5